MKRTIIRHLSFIFILVQIVNAQQRTDLSGYLEDESAPGARASMGIFAAGYGKALANELFDFKPNTWQNRLTSVGLAAFGYQVLSYNTFEGVEFKPFKLNKEWKGYWEGYLAGEGLDLFLGFVQKYEHVQYIVGSTILVSMGVIIAVGASKGGWRKANDGPLTFRNLFTNRHSYWIHFAGSGGLYWAISNNTATQEQALLYTSSIIWLWEVKDGYLRWEDYGVIGSDGFSWRDGVTGTIAAFGGYAFDKWMLPLMRQHIFNTQKLDKGQTNLSVYPDFYNERVRIDLTVKF